MTKSRNTYRKPELFGKAMKIVFLAGIFCLMSMLAGNSVLAAGMALPANIEAVASQDWSDATSWSPQGVPTLDDDVIIRAGQTITIRGTANCRSLTVEVGASLILEPTASLTIAGNLTVNGTWSDQGITRLTGAGSSVGGASSLLFNHLQIDVAGGITSVVTLNAAVSANSLSIQSGLLELKADLVVTGSYSQTANVSGLLLHDNSLTLPVSGSALTVDLYDSNSAQSTMAFSEIQQESGSGSIRLAMHEQQHPNDDNTTNYMNRYWEISTEGLTRYDLIAMYPQTVFVPDLAVRSNLVPAHWDGARWTPLTASVGVGRSSLLLDNVSYSDLSLAAIADIRPTATISGDDTICKGSTGNLSVALTGTGPWNLVYSNGTEERHVDGIAASPYNFTDNPAVTTTYTLVSVTDASGVTVNLADSHQLTVEELQLILPADEPVVCSGEPFRLEPAFTAEDVSFSWSRSEVAGISNVASSGSGSAIIEQLTNTGSNPVTVVYSLVVSTASGCSETFTYPVVVNPSIDFSFTVRNQAGADTLRYCEFDDVYVTVDQPEAWRYELEYRDGTYDATGPEIYQDTPGNFRVQMIAGVQTLRLTAYSTDGSCSLSEDIPIKVFGNPVIGISLNCTERSLKMRGTLDGDLNNPLNFTGEDVGYIEYSYDNGASWTTVDEAGPGLPFGPVTVYARNSASPGCYTLITADMGLGFVNSADVEICQGQPHLPFSAEATCFDWLDEPHVKDLAPQEDQIYVVTKKDITYEADVEVAYAVTDIFIVDEDDPVLAFNDNNSSKSKFSYSIYEYPFDPAKPAQGFVRFIDVGEAKSTAVIVLDPDKYYQMVVNDYDITSDNTVNFQFNKSNKAKFINAINNDVSWYDEDMNFITTGSEFDPVEEGIIPDVTTPGEWIFYVGCANTESCMQEVRYVINPYPVTSTAGDLVYCSSEQTDIRLSSVDALHEEPIDPNKVNYSWTAVIRDSNPDVQISRTSCEGSCGSVIRETVQNTGTTTGYIDFTVSPSSGSCVGEPLHFTVVVEPMPQFTIVDNNGLLCPDNAQMLLVIDPDNSSAISGLSFEWSRDNLDYIPGNVAATGTGDATGFDISGQLVSLIPNSVQKTAFTVNALVNDHLCATELATVQLGDTVAPDFDCPKNLELKCYEEIPEPSPEALGATDNCTAPEEINIQINDQLIGASVCDDYILRTYRATDFAGNYTECQQKITVDDNTAPVLQPVPIHTYCVDRLKDFFVSGGELVFAYSDYYRFQAGSTDLDLNPTAYFSDNCTSADDLALHWTIVDDHGDPIKDADGNLLDDETGQPSELSADILFVNEGQQNRYFTIRYWLEDSCGNMSEVRDGVIEIVARPEIELRY
ncbi:PKD-like domain-containing protein [Mangrovibacterium marinum]|nr:PKD-like domain-containing protein [Mangrovibacterium marinum]